MAVPREDYDLRLGWTDPSALTSTVLDLVAVSHDEVVALIAWQASPGGKFLEAGFSVIRFTAAGKIRWQTNLTICGSAALADCGKWVLDHGAITTDDGTRFIVIGTIINIDTPGIFDTIGVGIDDGGVVAWKLFYHTTLAIGRAIGIAPLAKSGEFLVVSRNAAQTDTWLYAIDRNGAVLTTPPLIRFFKRFPQRLRALPTQGLCILGTSHEDPDHPMGWILNIDPTTGSRAWERTYNPGDGTQLRWCDVAEGKDALIAIGNSSPGVKPFVVTLANNSAPDVGNVRAAFRPAADDTDIVVNGIAPSSICGSFNEGPWHIAIDDWVKFLWQKKYDHGHSKGSLTPIVFTNSDAVVVGGFAVVGGTPVRALLVQSKFTIGSPAPFGCGEETNAVFQPIDLSSEAIESTIGDLFIASNPGFVNQARPVETEEGCLP